MTAPAQNRRRVLCVDDNVQFLATIQPLLQELSGGAWEIITAESANRAFTLLQEQPADLAVLDIEMSVVDGIQLLSLLNRGYPQMQKAVLTGLPNEKNRAACLANGAELFLEKPKTAEGWQSLYTALNELLRFQPEHGFRGVLRRVGLQDVLQMECLARSSSILEIADGQQRGEVFVEEGKIIHAQFGAFTGEEAFNQLMALRGGQFNLKTFTAPPSRTISGQWEFLLMEAARKHDEQQAAQTPPPVEPAAPEHPAALAQARVETLLGLTEAGEHAPPTETPRPVISEMLVCSAQGEVLYEWQIRSRNAWVNFFEFLSQRSQRLAQGLNPGEFDRLEIHTPHTRSIVIINADSGVLVTAGNPAAPAARPPPPPAVEASLRDALSAWLRQTPLVAGEYLRALRFADKTFVCDCDSPNLPRPAIEQACRCATDAFHVLTANQVPADRLLWHYQLAGFHCARRADGTVLGVLVASNPEQTDFPALASLLEQFLRTPIV